MKYPLIFGLLFFTIAIFAQEKQPKFSGKIQTNGVYASEQLPFWFYANSNTFKNELTNAAGLRFRENGLQLVRIGVY